MPVSWWNNVAKFLLYLTIRTLIGDERRYLVTLLRIGVGFSEAQPRAFTLAMNGQRIEFPKERETMAEQLSLPLE